MMMIISIDTTFVGFLCKEIVSLLFSKSDFQKTDPTFRITYLYQETEETEKMF